MNLSCGTARRLKNSHQRLWTRGTWWRSGTRVLLLCLTAVASASRSYGDDEPERSKADAQAGQRIDLMRGAIAALRTTSFEIESKSALKFAARPLLRYHDQSRETGDGVKGVLDASVWRLGETGRPIALVTLEIYPVSGKNPLLAYEFVSLSPKKFEMKSTRVPKWAPHGTELSMAALDGAPPPADTARGRLAQMRELARRFTAHEEFQGQKIVCRLLPQPIDRYDDAEAGITDGAILVFANGTNPEMGLLLECSDKQWSYGAFRLTAAALFAEFDGKTILEMAKLNGDPVNGSYTGAREWVVLPE